MLRIVIDTAVLVAAFRSATGASNALLRQVAAGHLKAHVTVALFIEYEATLKRPEQWLATGMSLDQVDGVLSDLAAVLVPVETHFLWRPQLRDPADEMVLEAAANGRVDALVTFNLRDFRSAADRFQLQLCKPVDILRMMRQ